MKEYGGYLPIELEKREEYYHFDSSTMKRVNSGRTAIISAVIDGGYDKVFVPLYMCESVLNALKERNISFEKYHIGRDFQPIDVHLGERDLLIWPNYYGIMSRQSIQALRQQYKNILFDNTQAFFSEPILDAYNVYSCRKFFGVSDGAYLIHDNMKSLELKEGFSSDSAKFLLKSLEYGTNAAYEEYLENEARIANESIRSMSILTCNILKSIDYQNISQKRRVNFMYLHDKLKDVNELHIQLDEQVPMVYPLLIENNELRKHLVENRVYVPQWWRWILESKEANAFEMKLSKYLIPLPIDQRYDKVDMEYLSKIILNYIKK